MLELLHIENIAIIEEAEIAFRPGFNALTGETGAGKSIVIDAMSAVLGQRTSRDLIRTGASKAFVSALFSHVDPALCEELGAAPDENGDLMLQREIGADGKNVCRVGGRPVTVSQLRTLGSRLVNIHGQHDGQQLLDEEQHLAYLDSFGKVENLLDAYIDKYNSLTEIRRKMNALQMDEAEKARRMDTLQYQIGELERAKLKSGEEEELQSRRNLLRNAEKFISAVSGADYALNGGEDGSGVLNLLRQAQDALGSVRHLDEGFNALYERLESAYSEAYDIAFSVAEQRENFDFSPNELDEVEGRLDQLYRLKKKYGATVEDMLAYLDNCRKELDDIAYAGDALARLEKDCAKAEKAARKAYYDAPGSTERQLGMDFLWWLWAGRNSPIFGRDRMTTFERRLIKDESAWTEPKNSYYALYQDPAVCDMLLKEFGLEGPHCHIINGHIPVKAKKGESPIKGGGKLVVIDGGFCKAYQPTSGIAGYTLIFNSWCFRIVSHQPFAGRQDAIENNHDIANSSDVFERLGSRMRISQTDIGRTLQAQSDDLCLLLEAYRSGAVTEGHQ